MFSRSELHRVLSQNPLGSTSPLAAAFFAIGWSLLLGATLAAGPLSVPAWSGRLRQFAWWAVGAGSISTMWAAWATLNIASTSGDGSVITLTAGAYLAIAAGTIATALAIASARSKVRSTTSSTASS